MIISVQCLIKVRFILKAVPDRKPGTIKSAINKVALTGNSEGPESKTVNNAKEQIEVLVK